MTRSRRHVIRQGFDIRIAGAARSELIDAGRPDRVGADIGAIPGVRLRTLVAAGELVCRGDPVMASVDTPRFNVAAPAAGRVSRVHPRSGDRAPWIEIATDPERANDARPVELPSAADAAGAERPELARRLRDCGLWPLLRERPLGGVAGDEPPQALFVNGMDTEPLAVDPAILLADHAAPLAHGLALIRRLVDGPVYLAVSEDAARVPVFAQLPDVEVHHFAGPHPAGLAGTHINVIAPLRPGTRYWTIRAQDLARIGEAARARALPSHRRVVVAGPRAAKPAHYAVQEGAPLHSFVETLTGDVRIVQGTVLSGVASDLDDCLSLGTHMITVIGDGAGQRDLFGWARPRFDQPSASRAVFGWLRPRASYDIDARLHGEPRAIVNIGAWDKVMPLDVNVSYLVRAIQAGDVDEAVRLGLLDVTEEDMALCSYVDPCKLDVGAVVRQGLELYAREAGRR